MNIKSSISGSWLLAAGITLAATLWMLSATLGGSSGDKPADIPAAIQPREVPLVQTLEFAARPMVSRLVLTGRTLAARQVVIKAETAGVIAAIALSRGAAVAEGDLIMRFAVEDRQAQLLQARSALADAHARHEASRRLEPQGFQAQTELARAKAELDAANAAVLMAELELKRVEVRAPFAGVINERYVETGDFVERGQALALIVDLDPIRVLGQVSERYLGQIAVGGDGAGRTLDGQSYKGRISYIGRIAEGTTRTIPVELEISNPDRRLIEGITVELSVPVEETYAHLVPLSVLSLADDGTLGVKSITETNSVEFHPVRILGDSDQGLWIGSLPPRIRLITAGQAFVQPGQTVEARAADTQVSGAPQ